MQFHKFINIGHSLKTLQSCTPHNSGNIKAKSVLSISFFATKAQRCNWWVCTDLVLTLFMFIFVTRIKPLLLHFIKAQFLSCMFKITFLLFLINTTCPHLQTMSHSSSSSTHLKASSPPKNSFDEIHLDPYQSFLGWGQDNLWFYTVPKYGF